VVRYTCFGYYGGKPTISPFTANDLQWLTGVLQESSRRQVAEKRPRSYALSDTGYSWVGLIVGHRRRIGWNGPYAFRFCDPFSDGQLEFIRDLHPTVMTATPSFLLHITEVAKESGIDLRKLGVQVLTVGAEASTQQTRDILGKPGMPTFLTWEGPVSYSISTMNVRSIRTSYRRRCGYIRNFRSQDRRTRRSW